MFKLTVETGCYEIVESGLCYCFGHDALSFNFDLEVEPHYVFEIRHNDEDKLEYIAEELQETVDSWDSEHEFVVNNMNHFAYKIEKV